MTTKTSLQLFLRTHVEEKELIVIIEDIARASKYISSAIVHTDHGLSDSKNAHDEEQIRLDILSNTIIKTIFTENKYIASIVSEEEQTVLQLHASGTYSIAFDPLDGSSLVDANLAIGSIFSVFKSTSVIGQTTRNQVAALYVVYGPRTVLVLSTGNGVHEFLLNEEGEYMLIRSNITVNPTTTYYSPGNLRAMHELPGFLHTVNRWQLNNYTLRYSGCMVADIHHIFTKGQGVFIYLGGSKYPNGKLRLAFECGPFAYLMNQAGGYSHTSVDDTLNLVITSPEDRCPIIIGSKNEVNQVVGDLQS